MWLTTNILLLSFSIVHSGVLDNVNDAIIANFREEFASDRDTRSEIESFLKSFGRHNLGTISDQEDGLKGACKGPENVTLCKEHLQENCINVEELYQNTLLESENQTLSDWFPPLLYSMHSQVCAEAEPVPEVEIKHQRKKPSSAQAWGYGIGFVTLICCVANVGCFMAPFMKKSFFQRMLMFCVALAVGTLAATGFLVLIPESLHLSMHLTQGSEMPDYRHKMATVMAGIYFFYISERLLKIWFTKAEDRNKESTNVETNKQPAIVENNHGHSHFPGVTVAVSPEETNDNLPILDMELAVMHQETNEARKLQIDDTDNAVTPEETGELTKLPVDDTEDPTKVRRTHKLTPIGLMILIGDALHNFVDGIAIGAAFTENTYLGISVSMSVICEELPHELGDIAILLHTGLNMRRSLCYNFLAALTCYVGLVVGIILGENTDANMWIFAVAGGMFVYLSLVDMVPEMTSQMKFVEESGIENKWTIMFIQNVGLIAGFAIIMLLVMYGGNIEV